MDTLPEEVDEVVLVVGYKREQIIEYFRHEYISEQSRRLRVSYVVQEETAGTFRALEFCRDYIEPNERFLMLYSDDLIDPESQKVCVQSSDLALLTTAVEDATKYGVLDVDAQNFVCGIEEKPKEPKSHTITIGAMLLDSRVFKFEPPKHASGEYVLTDAVGRMIAAGIPFRAIPVNRWIPIGTPEELDRANANDLDRRKLERRTGGRKPLQDRRGQAAVSQ
jgi:glucose-1-phosphate thymidylyltransferase